MRVHEGTVSSRTVTLMNKYEYTMDQELPLASIQIYWGEHGGFGPERGEKRLSAEGRRLGTRETTPAMTSGNYLKFYLHICTFWCFLASLFQANSVGLKFWRDEKLHSAQYFFIRGDRHPRPALPLDSLQQTEYLADTHHQMAALFWVK